MSADGKPDPLAEAIEVLTEKVAREVRLTAEHADVDRLVVLAGLLERVKALRPSMPAMGEPPAVTLDNERSFSLNPEITSDPDEYVRVSSGEEAGAGRVTLVVRDDECAAVWLSLAEWEQIDAAARKILAGGAS